MEETPNWLEMPDDLMANILQRLHTGEILSSARKVCTTWRRICKNPEMWKVIVMHNPVDHYADHYNLERLTEQVVDLSCGELIDISIEGFGTDELLDHIASRSCKLKRLSLTSCYDMTRSGLIQAVKRVPQLEELSITKFFISTVDMEAIGQNCPQLKSLTVDTGSFGLADYDDGYALAIANNMPQLRCLQFFDRDMTNNGLQAIINGCPHLESLYIRMCHGIDMVWNLRKLSKILSLIFMFEYNEGYKIFSSDMDSYSDYDD
ncbi:hypothetical protein L2E82_39753 [Cichorium intybus]|uniref:Uncharacterized protein n=1 Tax=Cichorium intybus TaxID=13427 RepID=A0ACB9AK22_CICIN|nr:hypothetical protein L2E82_39753 [Cichorium intybus]